MVPLRFYVVAALIMLCSAGEASSATYDSLMVESKVAQGDSLSRAGDWQKAIQIFQDVLTVCNDNPRLVLNQGRILQKIGQAFRHLGKFEDANQHYFEALPIFKKLEASQDLIDLFGDISLLMSSTNPLQGISYADSALHLVQLLHPKDSLEWTKYLFEFADRHRTASLYRKGASEYRRVLRLLLQQTSVDSMMLFNTYYRLGGVLARLDKKDEGLANYQKAEKILLERFSQDVKLLRRFYQNIAHILDDLADFDRSLDYRKRYCDYYFSRGDSNSFEVSRAMNDLGLTYERRGEYEKARAWYERSLANHKRIYGPESVYTAFLLNNVGNIYKHLENYTEGLPLLEQALSIFTGYFGEDHIFPANVSSNIGDTYIRSGHPDKALPYNSRALEIRRMKLGPYHADLARDYRLMGDAYIAKGDFTMGVGYYDSSIIATKYDPQSGFAPVISYSRLYQALEQKAAAFSAWYKRDNGMEFLEQSIALYVKIDELTDYLRSSYQSEGSKRYLLANQRKNYNHAIDQLLRLYHQTGLNHHLSDAFRMCEKSRSIILYEALMTSQASHFSQIPEALIEEERTLKWQIGHLEKQEFEWRNKGAHDTLRRNEIEKELALYRARYKQFINSVAYDYPHFFELKYKLVSKDILDLKRELSSDQLFIEYFVGEEKLFVFAVTAEASVAKIIPLDFPLADWITQLRESIYGYAISNKPSQRLYDSLHTIYVSTAHKLYARLLSPLQDLLAENECLIISPDQELNYLPFEALLTQVPSDEASFKTYPYLIRHHTTHYVPSATLWEEMAGREQIRTKPQILAYAPSFPPALELNTVEQVRSAMGKLHYNSLEVKQIADVFPVKAFLGEQASRRSFLTHAEHYPIIHLATHGKANDLSGDYSFLAFHDKAGDTMSNILYAADIYNLNLSAEMVVLSACETGIGELQRGEGMISLARAFSYAGAKSLITTLWVVNDEATSELMRSFYEKLQGGISKSASLSKAKLDYINEVLNPAEAHPFYWSGVISLGDLSALPRSGRRISFLLGIVILVIGLFALIQARKGIGKSLLPSD